MTYERSEIKYPKTYGTKGFANRALILARPLETFFALTWPTRTGRRRNILKRQNSLQPKNVVVPSPLTVPDMFSRAHAAFKVSTGLATEAAIRLALCAAFYVTDVSIEPFVRVIQREEAWLYANPRTDSYFPTSYLWATVAFAPPLAVAVVHALFVAGWKSQRRRECATDVVAAVLVITLLVGTHTPVLHADLKLDPNHPIVYKPNLSRTRISQQASSSRPLRREI